MNLSPQMKRRLLIFGTGACVGVVASFYLLSYAFKEISHKEPIRHSVVVSKCHLKSGDVLKKECVETRSVPDQYLPPNVLLTKDLSWHVNRKLTVEVEVGSAFRTVDFEAPTSEGYIR